MKRLPIGVQEFPEMINNHYLYVDKTEAIHRLVSSGKYYFLSRPRRFGKSLLISTLQEIFLGHQALFEGLWIYDKIDWQPHPVILLDFSKLGAKEVGLPDSINRTLDDVARSYQVTLTETTNALKFKELIQTLVQQQQVVILIDEYDKPIIDHIENIEQATQNREILKNLYSVVKGNDAHIAFFLMTGVSKFTQVSIFSDLNNLNDITLDPNYTQLLGYTGDELETYFADRIAALATVYADVYPDIQQAIRDWYNGYSWDGRQFVYNPFSLLNLFAKQRFGEYWFKTATPTFLMKLIRENRYTVFDLENRKIPLTFFDKYDIDHIEINSLLFQTGYLTMKAFDLARNVVTLDFPNQEVEQAFAAHLLAEFNQKGI